MAVSLRADAERNRSALLAAARQVFGEQGIEAPLDRIARRAQVGNATLYRHFPNRRELIGEVLASWLSEYVQLADRAIQQDDPWAGFVSYVTGVLEIQPTADRLSRTLSGGAFDDDERLTALRAAARRAADAVITRAQRTGRLRPDFTRQDISVLLMGNWGILQRAADPQAWRRQLTLLFDGLAAGVPSPR